MKNNWQTKKLGEIIKLEYGKPLPKSNRDSKGEYPVYGANGVKSYSDKFYFDKPSIIVGRKGSAGELNLTEEKFWPLDVTYFITFDQKKYDLKFIYNLLETLNLTRLAKGVKPGINRNDVYSINVKIPDSFIEQKKIVKILDEVFEGIGKAKENADRNLQNSRELFESYLQSVFENKKKDWDEKKWGDLCHFVRGPFGGSLKKSIFKENGFVVYEQKHAIHNHFNQLRYFIDEDKFNEMIRFEVKPGDIIMSCSGVTLGRVAIIPQDIKRGIINQALLKLTPNKNVFVHFLKYWLRGKIFQDIIFKYSGGAAIPNVPSAKILKDILIPLPSLSKQKSIVKKLDGLAGQTRKLEEIYKKKLADLEELKKSVLQKAFSGEM